MVTALGRGEFVTARERAIALTEWFEREERDHDGFGEIDLEAVLTLVLMRTIYPD
jgi:hypothetical protein